MQQITKRNAVWHFIRQIYFSVILGKAIFPENNDAGRQESTQGFAPTHEDHHPSAQHERYLHTSQKQGVYWCK